MKTVEREREQMLAHWTRIFAKTPCWLSSPPPQIVRVFAPDTADRGMAVRKFHDKLGFCAKGKVSTGGLCSGAIFRTTAFMDLPQESRSGARATQTVHIEHTVPANVLARELESRLDDAPATGMAWLFKHSVTTAMRKGQDRDYLKGMTRTTSAFDVGSNNEGKPFKRYNTLFDAGEQVWDVWNRKAVDPDESTFDSHLETVLAVLHEARADKDFIRQIEAAA